MTKIGCVADDLTGATDVAVAMSAAGARTALIVGTEPGSAMGDADALVIAQKTRSLPVAEALRQTGAALDVLETWGATQILFKICSTFDSTDTGNIGPVTDAFAERLRAQVVPVTPAYPVNGRTVYQGHLFVGDKLLNESGMENHPLTPMRDPNLCRVLARQSRRPVGLVPISKVRAGHAELRAALDHLGAEFATHAIIDGLDDSDLVALANAARDYPLFVGGAGLGAALAHSADLPETVVPIIVDCSAPAVVIAGSCSRATLEQIQFAEQSGMPSLKLVVADVLDGTAVGKAVDFAKAHAGERGVLLYSSSAPSEIVPVQATTSAQIGERIEHCLGEVATALHEQGVRRFIAAGGETSGAVIRALGVRAMHVGPAIDPGVPWMVDVDSPDLVLALKSGNFGAPDFFVRAATCLKN